jgi:DNA-binding PadR family transcriptional regulator
MSDLPGMPFAPPGAHFAPRVRRGDVRAALLSLLGEKRRNGYQMIQEIQNRSRGIWRPSPGSVYPALQQLEDEGLVVGEESGGSRTFQLTDDGRRYVTAHADELLSPWSEVARSMPEEMMELRMLWGLLSEAFGQLTQVANARQVAAARSLLRSTRRSVFAILADDEEEEGQ